MKKISTLAVILIIAITACANEQLIQFNELPLLAQNFIQKYYNPADISYIEKDRDVLHNEYKLYLKDRTEIEFDHQGNLQSIDCHKNAVPEGIVPELITQYVALHHPNSFIAEYAIGHRHLQVELNNGLELIFDLEGHFLRIDD